MAKIFTPTATVTQQDGRIRIDIEDVNGKTSAVIPNEPMAREEAEQAAKQAQIAAAEAENFAKQTIKQAQMAQDEAEKFAKQAQTALGEAQTAAASSATAAKTSETNAKSWAVGPSGTGTDGTDSNNSWYWAKQSVSSASAAKTSQTAAASSASAAKTSETNAKTSETNAKTSETNAKTSETNAKTSETNAKTSEENAASSAAAASSQAAAAQKSATSAAASATSAADSASKAMATTPEGYEALVDQVTDMRDAIQNGRVIYGFHIDSNESDPDAAVTYLKDAVGMTPAKMDYTNGVFDYGSWEDAFFMPRPCMLNQDGTVAYYLDPNDLTKKEDGTDSDVADTTFAGNAMMEWGRDGKKIWLCVVPKGDGTSADVFISNRQVTDDYHAWSFMDANGAYIDHFYTPIYNGSLVDGVMRSISGQAVSKSLTATNEISYAKKNGDGWMIENYGDRLLISYLLILIGKSLATQAVFGQGITSGSETKFNTYVTGALDDKGLFYGSSGTSTAVKVFGMENWWGLQTRRTAGLVIHSGTVKYKLTESDADGASGGYTTTGAAYIDSGVVISGSTGAYIKTETFTTDGAMIPTTISGASTTTYYGDGCLFANSVNAYARFGGLSGIGAKCGAFCALLHTPLSYANWNVGAAVSCKPLA